MDCSDLFYTEDAASKELANQLRDWRARSSRAGAMLLVAEADQQHIPQLQQLSRDLGLPVVGGVFPELIWQAEFCKQGVVAMRFDEMPAFQLIDSLSRRLDFDDITARLKSLAKRCSSSPKTLFLLFDALYPRVSSLLDDVYLSLAGDVHYLGANAGSETFQPMDCLFDQDVFVQDAMLAVLLPRHPGGVLEHGYHVPENFTAATASVGNRISSIDWRPAFDVYTELARRYYGVEVNKENFYQYGVHFPFGIIRADGEVLVRIPVGLEEDGSVYCIGEVPENAVLTLLQAVDVDSDATIDRLAARVVADRPDTPLLTFYCAGRRMHMGDESKRELARLQARCQPRPVFGALSLGEIGNAASGYPLFHNATLVAANWQQEKL